MYRIFQIYVRFLTGKAVQPARVILGEPTRQELDCLIYETTKPSALMRIWFNKEGIDGHL